MHPSNNIIGGRIKAPAANDNALSSKGLTPLQAYAVRALARRSRISVHHALVAAQLAGIVREVAHG
jgi:hypothetical protein